MSLITERFTSGANGTNLQQAGVNVSHTIVNPNNASTLQFSNAEANPFTGGLIARSTAGAVAAEYRHDRTAATSGFMLYAFKVPASAPTSSILDFMQIRGTRQNAGMRLGTDGSLSVLNLGSVIGGAATLANFITTYAGQKVILQLGVIEGTTAANGRIVARLWVLPNVGAAQFVWEYDSGTTRDAGVIGTDTITSYRANKITAAAIIGTLDSYAHDANDGATTWLANPTMFAGAPSGTLSKTKVHKYDFTGWANKTGVSATITAGPALTINVNGFIVEVVDSDTREDPVTVQFTVTNSGTNTVVSDTIPVGGSSLTQVIEQVIATAATGSASDWE